MKRSDLKNLRNLGLKELNHKFVALEEDLRNFYFKLGKGEESNLMKAKWLRRDIARIHTICKEKQKS